MRNTTAVQVALHCRLFNYYCRCLLDSYTEDSSSYCIVAGYDSIFLMRSMQRFVKYVAVVRRRFSYSFQYRIGSRVLCTCVDVPKTCVYGGGLRGLDGLMVSVHDDLPCYVEMTM